MMGLSDGRKSVRIDLAVLIQYRSVTDTQPPSHPATLPYSYYAQRSGVEPNQHIGQIIGPADAGSCAPEEWTEQNYQPYAIISLLSSALKLNAPLNLFWRWQFRPTRELAVLGNRGKKDDSVSDAERQIYHSYSHEPVYTTAWF